MGPQSAYDTEPGMEPNPGLDETATVYFKQLFRYELSPQQFVELLKNLMTHPADTQERQIYERTLAMLFKECRYFTRYSSDELSIAGTLFGLLVYNELVTPTRLGVALRSVVESLKSPAQQKMFRFGILALEQFLPRIALWPRLCHLLTEMENLKNFYPDYVGYVNAVLASIPQAQHRQSVLDNETYRAVQPRLRRLRVPQIKPPEYLESLQRMDPNRPRGAGVSGSTGPLPNGIGRSAAASEEFVPSGVVVAPVKQEQLPLPSQQIPVERLLWEDNPPPPVAEAFQQGVRQVLESLTADNLGEKVDEFANKLLAPLKVSSPVPKEPQAGASIEFQERAHAILWLAHYCVKQKAAKDQQHQQLLLDFLDKLPEPKLVDGVVTVTYDALKILLGEVDQAVLYTSHRMAMKNLGAWLGCLTIARNKPLKSKQLDLKALLISAHEHGRLTAVLPLACKILEAVPKSKVFKLPNPWTQAILSLLAEIHDIEDLRTNLHFEAEVLCKSLDIKLMDLPRSDVLKNREPKNLNDLRSDAKQKYRGGTTGGGGSLVLGGGTTSTGVVGGGGPPHGGGGAAPPLSQHVVDPKLVSDGTVVNPAGGGQQTGTSPTTKGATGVGGAPPAPGPHPAIGSAAGSLPVTGISAATVQSVISAAGPNARAQHQRGGKVGSPFVISSLPNHVTIPDIPLFRQIPQFRQLVPVAVDRAIREIIAAVVERSVTISCLTTRETVARDFSMEPDENVLKKAAQVRVLLGLGKFFRTTKDDDWCC